MNTTIKSLVVAGIACILAVTPVFAASVEQPEKKYATIEELSKTPGLADLSKLSPEDQKKLADRDEIVNEYFREGALKRQKKAHLQQEKIQKKHQNASDDEIKVLDQRISEIEAEIKQHEKESLKIGLTPLITEKSGEVNVLSVSEDVQYDFVQAYKSSDGFYYFDAQAQWADSDKFVQDGGCYYATCEVGGEDGYNIGSLHKDITIYGKNFTTLWTTNNYWTDWTSNNPATDARGIGWIIQDEVVPTGSTWPLFGSNTDRYVGWIKFLFTNGVPSGEPITFKSKIGHTWDVSALRVSSFTMNSQGVFEINFSDESKAQKWRQEGLTNVIFY